MAAACYAMGAITTYKYCRDESALGLTLLFLLAVGLGGVISTTTMTVFPVHLNSLPRHRFVPRLAEVDQRFWMIMVLISVSVVGGMWAVNRAYQLTLTSYAAVYEYTHLITAVGITGWLFWGSSPRWL